MIKVVRLVVIYFLISSSIAFAVDKKYSLDDFKTEPDFSEMLAKAGLAAKCFGFANQVGWKIKAELLVKISLINFKSSDMSNDEAMRSLLLYQRMAVEMVKGYTMGRASGIYDGINSSTMDEQLKKQLISSWNIANSEKFSALTLYKDHLCDETFIEHL